MKHPKAIDKDKVGTYPTLTFSGGGYFYDEVLEYRVWVYPKNEEETYFHPFENYPSALAFSLKTEEAKKPVVLVLQKEYIDEPSEGFFKTIKQERITEWLVDWLPNSKRKENTLEQFIQQQGKI